MNANELKAELLRHGYSIPEYAAALGISKKTAYAKIAGKTNFTQPEIATTKEILNLSDQQLLSIFFADEVS